MEFSPFGTHKNATVSQTQDAWVKIHSSLRSSSYALFSQSAFLASSAWWVYQQMHANESQQNFQTIFLSLCIGAILFGMLSVLIARTYPQPITFPPHAAIRRLQVSRMLMLLFGAGYIVRGIDLLKRSGKAARAAGAYDEKHLATVDSNENVDIDSLLVKPTTMSIVESVMGYGAVEACLVCMVGAIGVLLSYWIGKELRLLRDAMKFTKSFKTS